MPAAPTDPTTNWPELLDRPDVLILDSETTRLGENGEIVEIAIIDTTGEAVLDRLVLPVGRIAAGAARVHGITRDMLRAADAQPWPATHARAVRLLRAASAVLIYNADFDRDMLEQTAARHGRRFPRLAARVRHARVRGALPRTWRGWTLATVEPRRRGRRRADREHAPRGRRLPPHAGDCARRSREAPRRLIAARLDAPAHRPRRCPAAAIPPDTASGESTWRAPVTLDRRGGGALARSHPIRRADRTHATGTRHRAGGRRARRRAGRGRRRRHGGCCR